MDVRVEDGGHLSFLDSRDSSGREEHEDGDVGLASDSVDGGTERGSREERKKARRDGERSASSFGSPFRPTFL